MSTSRFMNQQNQNLTVCLSARPYENLDSRDNNRATLFGVAMCYFCTQITLATPTSASVNFMILGFRVHKKV